MNKRPIQVTVAVVAVAIVWFWPSHQAKVDESKQTAREQLLLKKIQTSLGDTALTNFKSDLCNSVGVAEGLVHDISRIQAGTLLEQDLQVDVMNLSISIEIASLDIQGDSASSKRDSTSASHLALESKVLALDSELKRRLLQLEKGKYQENQTYFQSLPRIVIALGANDCASPTLVPTPTPTPSHDEKSKELHLITRAIADGAICGLKSDSGRAIEVLASINRGDAGVNAMSNQLLLLAKNLDQAVMASGWAHDASPLPSDASEIGKMKELSSFVYVLRVKYFQSQSKHNQEEITSLRTRISPLVVRACNDARSAQPFG